ncbi:hypothetical protein ASE48_16240 [Mycobacterium sp. Root265]|uniref:DUF732 domain-containing protein n=1 Tax=Mycobacterium sp. Root265 TaxID=1736504 RepID=UPI00070EF1E1|nr:hypothetical protein ASE48_16240 [Mycobacterium sp. Root265]
MSVTRRVSLSALIAGCGIATSMVLSTPTALADEVAYLVNVTVRPGYNFANAEAALAYGRSICGRVRNGLAYPELISTVKHDFATNDSYQASYLISQSAQELCPDVIWQLRHSAAGFRG